MKIDRVASLRDYNSYARQMDDNSDEKFAETTGFVLPGRVGDIGCATGSWLKRAGETGCFLSSRFIGVEAAPLLFSACVQRRRAGELPAERVSLLFRDALDGLVFAPESMDTIHTSSVTHEIYSLTSEKEVRRYRLAHPDSSLDQAQREVGHRQLKKFIADRHAELRPGGIWINRDVVGPEGGDASVRVELEGRSTFERFLQFARDYRRTEGYQVEYLFEEADSLCRLRMSLRDAWEFATKKDYTDNWEGEMHESFCFWGFSDWVRIMEHTGFEVLSASRAFTNPWIVEERLQGRVRLFPGGPTVDEPMPFPPTNMVLVARKRRKEVPCLRVYARTALQVHRQKRPASPPAVQRRSRGW